VTGAPVLSEAGVAVVVTVEIPAGVPVAGTLPELIAGGEIESLPPQLKVPTSSSATEPLSTIPNSHRLAPLRRKRTIAGIGPNGAISGNHRSRSAERQHGYCPSVGGDREHGVRRTSGWCYGGRIEAATRAGRQAAATKADRLRETCVGYEGDGGVCVLTGRHSELDGIGAERERGGGCGATAAADILVADLRCPG